MNTRSLLSQTILLCLLVLVLNDFTTARAITSQDQTPKITVPEAEAKAAKAIEAALDANAKLVAAEAFVKKYPASKARPQLAQYLAGQVFGVTDPTQKLAIAQKYIALFTEPMEAKLVEPALIDALVQLKRYDEAFEKGASYLANDTEDVHVRILLAITGAELAKAQNVKHLQASRQFGVKAIELIEADKKPANMDDGTWVKKKAMLPALYQQVGIILLVERKPSEAEAKLEKAAKLIPSDPFNHAILGSITNNDYQTLALSIRSMPEGKAKDDMLQRANQILDKVIEQYARAVALATGKPEYETLRKQVLQDLTAYYKYRHNNSDEGLQKYIDGYKLP